QAENSALALANENQREAYERCLDEVAIHVVQALLNQKDLREECIKLKKRVFDLERQNQTLSDLFHQKLQITSGSLAQVQTPLPPGWGSDHIEGEFGPGGGSESSPLGWCVRVEERNWPQSFVNGERPRNTSTCLKTAMNSMEALSPFFKKKAHILEVLRKLKEVDPLLICPTSVHHSACRELSSPTAGDSHILSNEYSVYFKMVLRISSGGSMVSMGLLVQTPGKVACKEQEVTDSQLVSLPHCLKENEAKCLPSSDDGGENVMEKCSLGVESSITSEKPTHLNQLLVDTESYLYSFMREKGENCSLNGDLVPYPFGEQNCANVSSNGTGTELISSGKQLEKEAYNGVCVSNETLTVQNVSGGPSPSCSLAEKNGQGFLQLPSQAKSKSRLSPTSPSSPGENNSSPTSSPSKLLKFLKMPTAGEKSPNQNHLRLSPQLTRSSKIPCRNNNYEICYSPLMSKKNHSNNGYSSPKAGRRVTCEPSKLELYSSVSSEYLIRSCQKMHNYENISDFSKGHLNGESTQSPVNVERLSQSISAKHRVSDLKTVPSTSAGSVPQGIYRHSNMREKPEEKGIESPQPVRRNSSSSSPPKLPPQAGKKPADSSYHPFKERLTALGKLKSTDPIPEHPNEMSFPPLSINSEKNRVSGKQHDKTAGSFESTDVKYSGSADSKAQYKPAAGTNSLKVQGHCGASESGMRTSHSNSLGCKVETENNSSKNYVAKPEVAKNRITDASCSPGSPQISRSSTKQSSTQNSSKNVKSPHGSPTKLPSRSPSKVASPAFSKFGATKEAPRQPCKMKDNGSPPYSKTPSLCINGLEAINSETLVSAPINQSAIEEKVMKGIEANMLKLQGQDRVHVVEVKQKTSSGIAGWFGRKKSKLPALSRKPETSKGKEDKREWKVTSSPVTKEVKQAAKKLEVESLNISMLMEKAEDLRRALEEEKAYINEKSRLHPCDVLVEQTQNELKVMYQEMTTDNFMQQLLNRVDDKGAVYESRTGEKSHPRSFQKASHESKSATAPLSAQRSTCPRQTIKDLQDTEKVKKTIAADLVNKDDITSDESLADSVTSQPFAGCGSLTRTLDSGIGTFPPPDYPSSPTGISIPKLKSKFEQPACLPPGKSLSVTRVPCKARTLERDMPSGDGVFVQRVELSPPVFGPNLGIPESEVSHQTCKLWNEVCFCVNPPPPNHLQNKNWTFPNSRTPGTASDAFLCVTRDGEALQGSRKKLSSTEVSQHTEVSNIPMRLSLSFGRRASSRIPCGVELGEENLVAPVARETRSEPQSPQRQLVLETSESLSDSLYDSLSSCGSQN
uniref:NCK associated protein 5 like n=1 Tax=Latimeria chalumnae TaxID=7897 RepID=H3BI44_LATCH